MTVVPPRIYAMVATRAPVAVVFWHGPGGWWHLGRWDLTSGDCEPGAWFRGRLYPRRGDLSPDGTLLRSDGRCSVRRRASARVGRARTVPAERRPHWDERRSAIMAKPSPAGGRRLVMEDRGLDLLAPGIEGRTPAYAIEDCGRSWELDATWADWDHQGRLLIATPDARLQLRDPETPNRVLREHDLSSLQPNPQPAPDWAHRW